MAGRRHVAVAVAERAPERHPLAGAEAFKRRGESAVGDVDEVGETTLGALALGRVVVGRAVGVVEGEGTAEERVDPVGDPEHGKLPGHRRGGDAGALHPEAVGVGGGLPVRHDHRVFNAARRGRQARLRRFGFHRASRLRTGSGILFLPPRRRLAGTLSPTPGERRPGVILASRARRAGRSISARRARWAGGSVPARCPRGATCSLVVAGRARGPAHGGPTSTGRRGPCPFGAVEKAGTDGAIPSIPLRRPRWAACALVITGRARGPARGGPTSTGGRRPCPFGTIEEAGTGCSAGGGRGRTPSSTGAAWSYGATASGATASGATAYAATACWGAA